MFLYKVPYFKEYVATFGITLSMITSGTHLGWTSPILPKLLSPESRIEITHDEASWVAAFLQLGGIVANFFTPSLANRFGRKATIVMSAIPFIASWVILLLAESYIYLYVGRIFCGIAIGMVISSAPLYIGEIASKEIRGALGILLTTSIKIGIVLSYSIGPYVSYEALIYILIGIPILLMTTIFWIPETPIYYIIHNREKDALKSLRYLRPQKSNTELQIELDAMYELSKQQSDNKWVIKELFTTRGNRTSLLILMVLFCGGYLSGYIVFIFHSVQVFEEAAGTIGANESVIILALLQLVVTIIAFMIVDKVGRRPLLLSSMSGIVFTNMILGIYFYAKDYKKLNVSSFSWLPITIMIIFILSYSLGLSTIPNILLGELFSTNTKGAASSITIIVSGGFGFAITKLYQIVTDTWGIYVSYWIFATCSFLVAVTIYFKLPETKGKSLDEIQVLLNKEK